MGFRPDLDISAYVTHFDRLDVEAVFGVGDRPMEPVNYIEPEFYRSGIREVEASTETALVPTPAVIWDTNRYYRDLGIPFPYRNIRARDLRLAYLERGGVDSDRLTYVIKQLLNPDVRYYYDRVPLGEVFLDRDVRAMLKRMAVQRAHQIRQMTKEDFSVDEVLNEWGYEHTGQPDQDETLIRELEEVSRQNFRKHSWEWSYFQYRSRHFDNASMRIWQGMLIPQLRAHGIRRFAVGFHGALPQPFAVMAVEGYLVIFLHEREEPTHELAAHAAIHAARLMVTDE